MNALSIHKTHPDFTAWALSSCGCFELGGLLFVAGSVGFLPNMGCGEEMIILGSWLYLIGSVFYVLGSGIAVLLGLALEHLRHEQLEEMRQHLHTQRREAVALIEEVWKRRQERLLLRAEEEEEAEAAREEAARTIQTFVREQQQRNAADDDVREEEELAEKIFRLVSGGATPLGRGAA